MTTHCVEALYNALNTYKYKIMGVFNNSARKKEYFTDFYKTELPPLLEELYNFIENSSCIQFHNFIKIILFGIGCSIHFQYDVRIVLCDKLLIKIFEKLERIRKSDTFAYFPLLELIDNKNSKTNFVKLNVLQNLQISYYDNNIDRSREEFSIILENKTLKEILFKIMDKIGTRSLFSFNHSSVLNTRFKDHIFMHAIRTENVDLFNYVIERASFDKTNNYKNTIFRK